MSINLFNTVKYFRPKSNVFDLSHDVKMSMNMGVLTPIACMETVPGDKFTIQTEQLLRMAPMLAPVMHKVDVYTHFFFVPNRIIWPNWEKFITNTGANGQPVTAENPPVAFPTINASAGFAEGSLGDYLGLPTATGMEPVSALPFVAYQKIFMDYYSDQNLMPLDPTGAFTSCVDGDNGSSTGNQKTNLRSRCWQHDYFTGALPFAQKGDAVTIPIGDFGDVGVTTPDGEAVNIRTVDGTPVDIEHDLIMQGDGTENGDMQVTSATPGVNKDVTITNLIAKTSELEADAVTINSLRTAFKLQEWLEKNARGGTRYIENILTHFGVKSSDARLQRPEYLGGSKQNMVISEVLQTSTATDVDANPTGNMAGHGVSVGVAKGFRYRCEEHGYIIGIISIMPKPTYQQGVPRHFIKFDTLKFYWPSFAHLGEQEVYNREVYDGAGITDPYGTFGYVPRYSEYKFLNSRVSGDFRSSLSYWHMGRIFTSQPHLNSSFVECDPTTRIFAVEDPYVNKIYAHIFCRIMAVRPMPKFGTPSF